MAREFHGERIEVLAANPAGDVACDTTIATPGARAGIAPGLNAGIIRPVIDIDGGVEVQSTHAATTVAALMQLVDARRLTLNELHVQKATLEDVFIELTDSALRE